MYITDNIQEYGRTEAPTKDLRLSLLYNTMYIDEVSSTNSNSAYSKASSTFVRYVRISIGPHEGCGLTKSVRTFRIKIG